MADPLRRAEIVCLTRAAPSHVEVPIVDLPAEQLSGRRLIVLFGWLGLLTGVAEAVRSWIWDRFLTGSLFRNDHAIWMTPLAECCVFMLVGSTLWCLTCCLARTRRVMVVAAVLAFLSSLTLAWGYLYLWAILMLGCGFATWLVRILHEQPDRLRQAIRWTTPGLLLFVLAGALVQIGRRIDARPVEGQAPPANAPNVLLIVWDTVRADFVDWRPGNDHTPNLAELAARGTVFDRAIAPASWTLPSHASLFTGRYPDQLSSNWQSPLDENPVTLAELYQQAGYATGGFVGNLYYCTRGSGLNRGFGCYRDHKLALDELLRHSFLVNYVARTRLGWSWLGIYDELGRKDGTCVVREFHRWRARHGARPFFAFLNFFDAHDPYLPAQPPQGRRLTNEQKAMLRVWRYRHPDYISQADEELARSCYALQIHHLDRLLGDVVAELKRTGQFERTLIVVTGDHGEQFGEHHLYSHGNSVHRSVVHVPLLVSYPGHVPVGQHVQQPVSLCDVGQTVWKLSEAGEAERFPGVSLAAAWSSDIPDRPVRPALATVDPHPRLEVFPHMRLSPASRGKQFALLVDDLYVISEGGQDWRLFDFTNDPAEARDLSRSPASQAQLLQRVNRRSLEF